MSKWFKRVLVGLVSLWVMTTQAAGVEGRVTEFREGVHYTVLDFPLAEQSQVTEYFSYYCPHCYRLEPVITEIKAALPEGMRFTRSHVDFLRFDTQPNQETLTRASAAAVRLGVEHELTIALFEAVQVEKQTFATDEALIPLFASLGVSSEEAKKALSSFSVRSDTKKQLNQQKALLNARALAGVPTLIVNGKYRLNFKSLSRADFIGEVNALILHLEQLSPTKG